MSMPVYISFPVLKYSCFSCHSPACSDNSHSTLRCYEACSSQHLPASWDGDKVVRHTQDELASWNLHLDATFPMIPSHLSSWPILSSLLITGAKELWHVIKLSHNSHWFWLLQQWFSPEQSFFSAHIGSLLIPNILPEAVIPSARSETHTYIITFMYSSSSLIWSISKPFPLWRPSETQPQLSFLTTQFFKVCSS